MAVTGDIPGSKFCENIIANNNLIKEGFVEWAFYPGMLFNSADKWWGSGGLRNKSHEGIDVCLFLDKNGRLRHLDGEAQIPALYDGHIIQVIDDYIGKTVFMRHGIRNEGGHWLYSIYGHVKPCDGITTDAGICAGNILATIYDNGTDKIGMLPHVHLSIAWIHEDILPGKLNWELINRSPSVILLDPLEVLGCKYTILKQP